MSIFSTQLWKRLCNYYQQLSDLIGSRTHPISCVALTVIFNEINLLAFFVLLLAFCITTMCTIHQIALAEALSILFKWIQFPSTITLIEDVEYIKLIGSSFKFQMIIIISILLHMNLCYSNSDKQLSFSQIHQNFIKKRQFMNDKQRLGGKNITPFLSKL